MDTRRAWTAPDATGPAERGGCRICPLRISAADPAYPRSPATAGSPRSNPGPPAACPGSGCLSTHNENKKI